MREKDVVVIVITKKEYMTETRVDGGQQVEPNIEEPVARLADSQYTVDLHSHPGKNCEILPHECILLRCPVAKEPGQIQHVCGLARPVPWN